MTSTLGTTIIQFGSASIVKYPGYGKARYEIWYDGRAKVFWTGCYATHRDEAVKALEKAKNAAIADGALFPDDVRALQW